MTSEVVDPVELAETLVAILLGTYAPILNYSIVPKLHPHVSVERFMWYKDDYNAVM